MIILVKIVDLVQGADQVSSFFMADILHAETPAEEGDGAVDDSKDSTAEAGDDKTQASTQTSDSETDNAEDEDDGMGEEVENFSAVEVEILQQLAKRRTLLDKREYEIVTQENILQATINKLDAKIAEIKSLKSEVSTMLDQYKVKKDMGIDSLVKIYSGMKPKDAAKIFEELDMPVLIQVIDRMKENKVSPILAQMDPIKAKTLTVKMASAKRLSADTECVCK